MFILPLPRTIPISTEYFSVKSRQEMDVAPVIAMNFMRYNKFFLYFSGLSWGIRTVWIRHCSSIAYNTFSPFSCYYPLTVFLSRLWSLSVPSHVWVVLMMHVKRAFASWRPKKLFSFVEHRSKHLLVYVVGCGYRIFCLFS